MLDVADFTFLEKEFEEQKRKLSNQVRKKEVNRGYNIIRRAFVPTALQDDTITFKSNVITAGMGSGKTTLISAFANSIEDMETGWLAESQFTEPLIIFANSLSAVFRRIENDYQGENYLYIAVDDAIEHASSRLGMSRSGRRGIFDYARVRHIMYERCGVTAPSFANFFWVTQRFRELSPMMRKAHFFFYKTINAGEGDLRELERNLGSDAVDWLSGVTEQIYLWNNYEFMDYFLLVTAWDPSPIKMVLNRNGKTIRKYPITKDKEHDEQLTEIISFLEEYIAKRPDFLNIIDTKKGHLIISDLITTHYPETIVTDHKIYTSMMRRCFETGILTNRKKEGGVRARKWKKLYVKMLYKWFIENEHNKTAIMDYASGLGFKTPNAIRSFLSTNRKLIDEPIEVK